MRPLFAPAQPSNRRITLSQRWFRCLIGKESSRIGPSSLARNQVSGGGDMKSQVPAQQESLRGFSRQGKNLSQQNIEECRAYHGACERPVAVGPWARDITELLCAAAAVVIATSHRREPHRYPQLSRQARNRTLAYSCVLRDQYLCLWCT